MHKQGLGGAEGGERGLRVAGRGWEGLGGRAGKVTGDRSPNQSPATSPRQGLSSMAIVDPNGKLIGNFRWGWA